MKKLTSILCLFLTFVLVFSMLPITAVMAEETEVVETTESTQASPEEIEEQAICWHMGAFGQSQQENKAMGNAMYKNKLILLIQQADLASSAIFEQRFPVDQIPGI